MRLSINGSEYDGDVEVKADGSADFVGANGTVSIADGTVTAKMLKFSGDNSYATGIDNTWGKFTAAPANNYTLATTKTVYDNTYLTAAGTRGNYAAGSVLDAVASIDKAIGNRAILNGTNYANPGDSATTTNLAQAIKNMDTNVFAKVGTVDLSTAINYANTTTDPATNLTQAVVNIDKNVKAEINSLDNKYVTKEYFNNGEPAKLPDDSDNPNAGLISMGSGANNILIGKTDTNSGTGVTSIDAGLSISYHTDAQSNIQSNIMLGNVSQVGANRVVETGVNIDSEKGIASLISADGQNSINAVDVDTNTIKLGMTTTASGSTPSFAGVSINNGVMTNAKPGDATGAEKATFAYNEVAVTDGNNTASVKADGMTVTGDSSTATVKADEMKVATDATHYTATTATGVEVKSGSNIAKVEANKISVTDGADTSSMTATTVSLADTSGKSNTITKTGMTIADGTTANANVTSVEATGVRVTDGNSTTTVAADGVTSSKFAFSDTKYVTDIDAGTDFSADNAPAADAYTIATTATVKNSIDGMVSGIEKQIHGDGPASTVNIGDKAGTTFVGDTYVDHEEQYIEGGMAVRITYDDPTAASPQVTNREVELVAALDNGSGVSIDMDAKDQTIDLTTINANGKNQTGIKVSNGVAPVLDDNGDPVLDDNNNPVLEHQGVSIVSSNDTDRTSTGIEVDNTDHTISIASSNSDAKTSTGLNITNDETNGKHTIGLSYDKDIPNTVTAHDGLTIDADTHQIALTSTNKDAAGTKKSGLELDNNTNVFKLGASNTPTSGTATSYGMTMDANAGVTKFEDQDGKGVTMNKGDMTVTDSATVGSVDAQGALSGVKLDKSGTAQASTNVTAGQVKADGSLDGNGVQMKNDGSATFASTDGKVEVAKGGVTADNNVTVGDKSGANYIDMAKQTDGSLKATFASADGNVEIAGGNVTADNKVTANDIEAKNSIFVGDPAGEIAALYKTGLVAVKDADNQATYGSGGMWAKKKTDDGKTYAADFGGTGLSVSQLDPSDPTSVIASAGVSETGLWTQSNSKKSSYGNDGLWIGNKAETAFASLNEKALFITDGTDTSNIGLDGIYTSQNISAAGNSYVGGNSQVDGVATFGKDAGKQVVIDSGDVTADGKVKGKDLEATNSFTLADTTVHAIDDSNAKINDFSGAGHDVDTLATTSSIYYNAEDALYTPQQGTYTTVDAKTINEALTAVDNIIGNFPDGLNYDNHNLDNGGQAKPENIVDAFNNIDATLGQIHGLAAKVGVENGSMNLGQNTTVEEHLTVLAGSIGNRTSYTEQNVIKNNESVAKSLDALDMAVGDVSKLQGTAYANAGNLSDAVVQIDDKLQNLDGRMERAEKDLKDVHHELRRGMASMAAMSALVPNSRSTGKTSLSLGTGAYSGHAAVALGGFHYLTDNLMLNAGAAWSNSRDAVYRVGVTYSF